eukprot:CAMPEP_0184969892 /NCGR_PEP_ID=MMETSP1098-20130426/2512_1 /TAXON_ID=89044 /ORGANISM="Spumella elongata, Strain CCAP 955/1" /LENGTH=30 /DNA_ID= /DNA_START= /DNA_END= /DNA_ORIENTATION=
MQHACQLYGDVARAQHCHLLGLGLELKETV